MRLRGITCPSAAAHRKSDEVSPAGIILPKNFMCEPIEFEENRIAINVFNSMRREQYALDASGDYVFNGSCLNIVNTR